MNDDEEMLKDLARGGLTKKHALGHHLTSRSAKHMRRIMNEGSPRLMKKLSPGDVSDAIEIPYRGKDFSRYRLLKPITYTEKGKRKTIRYWQPDDSPVHLYTPKGVELESGILCVEGEKKAIYSSSLGLPAVAIPGVWCFRNDGLLLPELRKLAATGATLVIVFDGNVHTNPHVRKAREQFAQALTDAGAKVLVVDIPPDINFDDFLLAKGKEGFDLLPKKPFITPSVVESLTFKRRPLSVFTETPPERQYVVNPWFGKGLLSFLVGTGGMGKSFLMLDLAVAVAAGGKWLGMRVTRGRVVILSMEDPIEEMDRRLHYIIKNFVERREWGKKAAARLYKVVRKDVRIESLEGRELRLIREQDRNIVQTPDVAALAAKLAEQRPALVIIDPLSQLHTLEENSAEVGSAICKAIATIRIMTGAAIVVPAHTNKEADKLNSAVEDTMASMRGSTAAPAGGRSVIIGRVLSPKTAANIFQVEEREAVDRFARFTHVKQNYGPKAPTIYTVRGIEGVWNLHDAGEIPFKEKSAPGEMLPKLRRWLSMNEEETFSKTEVTQGKRKEIFGDSLSRTSAEKEFEAALNEGQIQKLSSSDKKRLKDLKGGGDRYRLMEEPSK